jgi:hypothetical protein
MPYLRRSRVTCRVVVTVDNAGRSRDRRRHLDEVVGGGVVVQRHRDRPAPTRLRCSDVSGVGTRGKRECDDHRDGHSCNDSDSARTGMHDSQDSIHR